MVTVSGDYTYDGKEQAVSYTVSDKPGEKELITTSDYTVSGETGTDAKEYTLTVAAAAEGSNYKGSVSKAWTISALDISDAEITLGDALIYNGSEQTQTIVSVKVGDLDVTYDVEGNKQTDAGNYELTVIGNGNFTGSAAKAWSIAPKAATVTANDESKTFGEKDPELTATIEGVIDNYALVYELSREEGDAVGTYAITATGDDIQGNYSVTYYGGTFTIAAKSIGTPKPLIGLVYDGTEQTGVPSGEGYTLTGDFKAINAGDYTATATLEDGCVWSDGSSDPAEVKWSIGLRPATVTANDQSKAVGTDDPALTATVEGVIDNYALVYNISRETGESIGEYTITVTGDAVQGNYKVSFVSGVFTITGIVIDKPAAATGLVYNGTEQTGVPSGEGYTLTGETAKVDAGDYTATATLADGYIWSDGSIAPADIPWGIGKKALDDSMVTVSGDYTYNAAEQTVSYTVSDKSGGKEIITSSDYTVTSGDMGINAGQYVLILNATESGNYHGQMSAEWSIAQKAATVTADDKTKIFGTADPVFTATVEGVIGGDKLAYTITRAAGETAGTYAITPSGEVSQGNYTVTYRSGELSIVYEERTITDETGRISIDGGIFIGAALVVKERYDPSDWEGVDLSNKIIQCNYDMELVTLGQVPYTGSLTITFDVGKGHDGTEVTVYHHGAKGIEEFKTTVQDNKVSITVSDLSLFIVTHDKNTAMNDFVVIMAIITVGVLLVISLAYCLLRKRKRS